MEFSTVCCFPSAATFYMLQARTHLQAHTVIFFIKHGKFRLHAGKKLVKLYRSMENSGSIIIIWFCFQKLRKGQRSKVSNGTARRSQV